MKIKETAEETTCAVGASGIRTAHKGAGNARYTKVRSQPLSTRQRQNYPDTSKYSRTTTPTPGRCGGRRFREQSGRGSSRIFWRLEQQQCAQGARGHLLLPDRAPLPMRTQSGTRCMWYLPGKTAHSSRPVRATRGRRASTASVRCKYLSSSWPSPAVNSIITEQYLVQNAQDLLGK